MRIISKWANRNPIASRFLITILHLLSIANALFLGVLFYLGDWPAATAPTILLAFIFIATYLLYPKIEGRLTRQKYWRQKRHDFTLVFSGALFLAFSVNNYLSTPTADFLGLNETLQPTVQWSAIGQSNDANVLPTPTKAEVRKARRSQIKELKASIKTWKKSRKGKKKGGDLGEILLILLVVVGAAFAGLLITALSCSLACSGAGGLALLLMIGGLVGIVFLSVVLIKAIVKDSLPAKTIQHE
ncbi:MAG: hypothetical protein AB8H12_16525 [Lewinella sp.]